MKCILVVLLLTLICGSFAQNFPFTCEQAVAFCGNSVFSPGVTGTAQVGPDYGCLSNQPSPAWFSFQIETGNNITINFNANNDVDIDYAIWGPFTSVNCAALETGNVPTSACSFSGSSTESAQLTAINPGETYIMLVTNFDQESTVVTVVVDGSTTNGALSCALVSGTPTNSPALPSVSTLPSASNTPGIGQLCEQGNAFCGLSQFVAGTVGNGRPGPNYGCLADQPAPAWFFFQISIGNNITIDLTNSNGIDIDYAIWGPFPTSDCSQINTGGLGPISCGFSPNAVERAVLTTVNPGEFYIMLITNFGRESTVITANVIRTFTNGDLNCGIVPASNTPVPSSPIAASASVSPSDRLGDLCIDADPFCGLSTFNPGTVGAAQSGINYGCLNNQPAPAWFFFRIARGNNITIDFSNSNGVDIDYAIWGPFTSSACTQIQLGVLGPISCSFSPDPVERAVLTTVAAGEFYIMLITNFARLPTVITANVDFANTNGDLDCGIVPASASGSFSPSTSLSSSTSFTPSTTPSTSFSPSTSLSNSLSSSRSESNSVTPSRTPTATISESNFPSSTRTPTSTISETRSITQSISLTRSSSPTRTPSRTPTVTATPSRTSRRSRTPSSTTTPTISETRSPRASRSSTRTPTATQTENFTVVPRTTGLRTTGVINRTTGVINRTTGVRASNSNSPVPRTTGVINRTTGVVNRTTGVRPSDTPSTSQIIESSAAFSASPFFSLIFVVLAAGCIVIA